MKDIVHIETSTEIRRRQQLESLERDKSFWQKTAEQLQDKLDQIFDTAQSDGQVMIVQRGKTIKLQVAPAAAAEPTAK